MSKRLFVFVLCIIALSFIVQAASAEEPKEGGGFIVEEEIAPEFLTELEEKAPEPRYITADILTHEDVTPALLYYIRGDIDRKFSGLITNLRLEKIHGIVQENKTATVYFDYSYTSVRSLENKLMDKGKMTLVRFNSGRWFNAELSIYLMDFYTYEIISGKEKTEE